jgi:sulfur-oxidizing protein SoxY
MQRRTVLGMMSACAGLLWWPFKVFATTWQHNAFEANQLSEAEKALGLPVLVVSKDIDVIAPDKAENGAIVQIEIDSRIPNTQQIMLLVEKNPTPLIAQYSFGLNTLPQIVTRIKMAETSDIKVVVKAGEQYFYTTKNVIVLENGCG